MLWGAAHGALELRQEKGGVRVSGRFPYATEAELVPGRFERIEAKAFAARIDAGEDVHMLSGHDYTKPLASRSAGTLELHDTPEALEFEARIDTGTTWAADFIAAHGAGLIRGLSPGFRVSPGGDRVEARGDGMLRSVMRAELFEISAVTRPAYPAAQIEARCWDAANDKLSFAHHLNRWRL